MWAPAELREHEREAGKRKAGKMYQSGNASGPAWHPERATMNPYACYLLMAVVVGIICSDMPGRKIRLSGDHMYLVPSGREPMGKFTVVFAYPDLLWCVINAVKDDFHDILDLVEIGKISYWSVM